MSATSDIVIKERRSPAATAAIIVVCILALLGLMALAGWLGWREGYAARGDEVKSLAEEARSASEDASRAEREKQTALEEAAREQSEEIRRVQQETSNAMREVEARATELLSTTAQDRNRLQVENEVLREKVLLLESERDAGREETVGIKQRYDKLSRELQIQGAAYTELKKSVTESSNSLGNLRDELNFYRSILSPEGEKGGLQIQNLRLTSRGAANEFEYRITLIQARKHDSNVRASVNLEIEGSQDGIGKIVDVGIFGETPRSADFKYYDHISGTFTLPDDFVATGAKVVVNGASLARPLEQWYPWPSP